MTRFVTPVLAVFLLLPAPASAQAPQGGPVVELAPEDKAPPKPAPVVALGAAPAADSELVRGLTEQRFQSAATALAHTSIGGYGEITLTGLATGSATRVWTADVRRVVLFVAHSFTQDIRVYTEFEVEHAKEAEIEQAYLDWKVARDYLGLRAGLVLVPMGITNEVHEPPTFNGVELPSVETVIIPSTWREIGAGFFGHPVDALRYELYVVSSMDPQGLSAGGFGEATAEGSLVKAKAWAAAGRVEFEPLLGAVVAASGYATNAGQNGNFFDTKGAETDISLPVVGFSLDTRMRRAGLEAKALYTEWRFPNAGALMQARDQSGKNLLFPGTNGPVPTILRGGYAELGYDVFHATRITHQLVPFARVEAYDTQAGVPTGYKANPTFDVREVTFGASYRPIREIVIKLDGMVRHKDIGPNQSQVSAGIGFMY